MNNLSNMEKMRRQWKVDHEKHPACLYCMVYSAIAGFMLGFAFAAIALSLAKL